MSALWGAAAMTAPKPEAQERAPGFARQPTALERDLAEALRQVIESIFVDTDKSFEEPMRRALDALARAKEAGALG